MAPLKYGWGEGHQSKSIQYNDDVINIVHFAAL